MTTHTNTTPWDDDPTLVGLEAELELLGQMEQNAAPRGMSDRIAAATQPVGAGGTALRLVGSEARPAGKATMSDQLAAHRSVTRLPMRLAAAVGVAATVAAALLAVRSGGTAVEPSPAMIAVSHPVEDWLTAAELWSEISGDELTRLTAQASSLSDQFDETWMMTDLLSDEEGSL